MKNRKTCTSQKFPAMQYLVKIIFYIQELLSMEMPITRDSVCMCRNVNSLWLYFVIII